MLTLIDYYTKAIVATFNGTNPYNAQLMAWLLDNDYKVHHTKGNKLVVIK